MLADGRPQPRGWGAQLLCMKLQRAGRQSAGSVRMAALGGDRTQRDPDGRNKGVVGLEVLQVIGGRAATRLSQALSRSMDSIAVGKGHYFELRRWESH